MARGDCDFCDHAGEGSGDVGGVCGVAFLSGGGGGGGEGFVDDDGFAGHAVELVEEGAAGFAIGLADGDELDDEDFPGIDLDLDFLADLEAVEEGGGGELGEIVVVLARCLEVLEHARIHEVGVEGVLDGGGFEGEAVLDVGSGGGLEIDGLGEFAGALGGDPVVGAEDDFLDIGRPSAIGLAEAAGEHVDDGLGEIDGAGLDLGDVGGFDATGDEEHAHVADDFRGRGDLDDVAEELVHLGIGAGDLPPAVAEAHGVRLLAEVGVLAAGHFVLVDFGGAGAWGGIEGLVEAEDVLPVIGDFIERIEVEAGILLGGAEGGADGIEVRLGGGAGHGGDGEIRDIDTGA